MLKMHWTAVANASAYRLSGPGIPDGEGLFEVSPTSAPWGGYGMVYQVGVMPVGTYAYRLETIYGPAGHSEQGTALATVAPLPDDGKTGRYRITVNGFRALAATNDDPILHRDGKGDEIFVAVFVGADQGVGQELQRKIVRTRVYGDVHNFPDRIRAGSSSATGGIGPLNWVPAKADELIVPMSAMPDRLPLLVWEGDIWDGDFGLAVVPTVWEWDGDSKNYDSWSGWLMGTRRDWHDVLRRERRSGEVIIRGIGPKLSADTSGLRMDESFGKDLPIGYFQLGGLTIATSEFSSRAVLLSRERLEKTLGTQQAVMFPVRFTTTGGVGGVYELYLQLERLPRTSGP
jgi:hypothetical protein